MSEPAHERERIHYPESDGQPLAETETHVEELVSLRNALKQHFRDVADVYVGANMFVYYERGNPRAVFAPDVFVALGVPKRVRRTYKLWEEGRAPSFVMEISSDSTWLEDTGNKKALCARLGVSEYFLFDPCGDYLKPRLQGFRLREGEYERIAPHASGTVVSSVLGVVFSVEQTALLYSDATTGERLHRLDELEGVLDEAQSARRDAEHVLRQAESAQHAAEERAASAEAELQRLRRELAKRGG